MILARHSSIAAASDRCQGLAANAIRPGVDGLFTVQSWWSLMVLARWSNAIFSFNCAGLIGFNGGSLTARLSKQEQNRRIRSDIGERSPVYVSWKVFAKALSAVAYTRNFALESLELVESTLQNFWIQCNSPMEEVWMAYQTRCSSLFRLLKDLLNGANLKQLPMASNDFGSSKTLARVLLQDSMKLSCYLSLFFWDLFFLRPLLSTSEEEHISTYASFRKSLSFCRFHSRSKWIGAIHAPASAIYKHLNGLDIVW